MKSKLTMQFRTQIPISKSNFPIDYNSEIVSLGSCFAENIGDKIDYFKFPNSVNPFGIIFNPASLEKLIRRSLQKHYFTEKDIFFHNDLWHCFDVHSEVSFPDKIKFLERLNALIDKKHNVLTQSTHVIITLGTAWIYRNIENGQIVANCHKVPQKQFAKELLSVSQINECLQNIISLVASVNPNCHFIFTVSPVRHIKDGFVENQLSKAHLIAALHETLDLQLSPCDYFPSYEIIMDELRDYRFYANDMLHPSQVAIDYIWERFFQTMISEDCYSVMQEIDSIQKALQHRPFNPDSESHQKFLYNLQKKIYELQTKMPHILF